MVEESEPASAFSSRETVFSLLFSFLLFVGAILRLFGDKLSSVGSSLVLLRLQFCLIEDCWLLF